MPQDAGLSWGSLQFAGEVDPDLPYQIHAVADGTNMGNPQPLLEIVKSLLTDGSLAVLQGWDNREIPIRLRLSAGDSLAGPALAAAESALMSEVMATSKSPLVWMPPALDAATCVFDVVAAKLERDNSDGWDDEENRREYRYYLLTLTCLPFARPEESVVVPALPPTPGSPTTVVIDTCDSTTGWSVGSFLNVTAPVLSASGGYVQASATSTSSPGVEVIDLLRAGSVTFGATPYLRLTASDVSLGQFPTLKANGDIGIISPVTSAPSPAVAGATDFYFGPLTGVTSLGFSEASTATYSGSTVTLRVHEVARTDTLPVEGTTRQQSRSATVSGSAPTQAAIRLFDATPADIGVDTLVYTTRSTASPALRPWLDSAAGTTDSAMVSGARNTLGSSMIFEVPASNVTDGTYALLARASITVEGTLSWSARMVNSLGSTTLGSSITATGSIALGTTSGYRVLSLGSLHLPIVAVEDDQMVELTLTGTADMSIDEAWLFNLDEGALTWISDPSTYLQWIEIRSPELGASRPSVYGGFGALGDNSTCVDFMCESFGSHRFDPGQMQVFTVTTSSLVSQSELEFYPRYHSHVEGS